jgi:hypothetical protein
MRERAHRLPRAQGAGKRLDVLTLSEGHDDLGVGTLVTRWWPPASGARCTCATACTVLTRFAGAERRPERQEGTDGARTAAAWRRVSRADSTASVASGATTPRDRETSASRNGVPKPTYALA